jgi:type II secretory pathway component GspD/PulD (secretin)
MSSGRTNKHFLMKAAGFSRLRWFLFLVAFFLASHARAQALEVIPLQHRTAEDILPQLKPFVEPGGNLGGMNGTLFLKASARNQAEIRKLIVALDTPPRRLMISVRQENRTADDMQGAGATGLVTLGDGSPTVAGRVKMYSSDRHVQRNTQQQVQTLDGGRAAIHVGQSFLVPLRQMTVTAAGVALSETYVQRDLGTGFVAVPRLGGDRVTLEISPRDDAATGGSVTVQRLLTTVSGRLGEWMELGGSSTASDVRDSGITRYGTRTATGKTVILLKVDELP